MSRILIIAHGHPELSAGGGERAAGLEAAQLRALGHEVLLIARTPGAAGAHQPPFSCHGQDLLFHSPDYDHFLHSQRAKWAIWRDLRAAIDRFAPDAAHLHHFVHLGLEMVRELRRGAPNLPILMTLHEFLAICHADGQMRTTQGGLCERADPAACARCFPARSPQDFFLRERFIKAALAPVDRFLCPSRFLLERYAGWGLPHEKLVLLENGQPPLAPPAAADPAALCTSFGFFGQISDAKGIHLLLDAAERLPPPARARIRIAIHGTLHHQPAEAIARFHARVAPLADLVTYHGAYRPEELPARMATTGYVVVPSLWWENSPLVIQEAFAARRPVLCSDIGGMAEKVADGVHGLHFRTGDPFALATTLTRAADPALWSRLVAALPVPPSIGQTCATLLGLVATISDARAPAHPAANGVALPRAAIGRGRAPTMKRLASTPVRPSPPDP